MLGFIKDVTSVGLSKIAIIFSGLLTSMIIARALGPDNNGVIAALLVYPSLFMSVGSLGIRQSTTYFLGKQIFTENQIKKAVIQIWFFTTIISIVICYFLMTGLSNSGENKLLVLFALAPIPFALFNTYNSGVFLGKNQIKQFNKINWVPSLLILVLTGILVLFYSFGIKGYLIALIGGPMFISFFLLFKNKFINSFSIKLDWKVIIPMISLGSVYAIALLFISLNAQLDIIILDKLSTAHETGIYSKGYSVSNYLLQIPWMLSTIVFTRSSISKQDVKFSKKVCQLLRISFVLLLIVSIILFLISDFLIVLMFGEEFHESALVLKYLLFGTLFLSLFKILNQDLAGKGKPWISMKAMIPGLIINIVFNFILIPKYGAMGAALASTISYSVAIVIFLHYYSLLTTIKIKELISYKKSDFQPIVQLIKKLKR